MLETKPIDLTGLGEDLQLAIAAGEYTADRAVAYILHLCGPEMTDREARRVLRRADPSQMACTWERHPTTGEMIPQFGLPRRVWDRMHGRDRNRAVVPELAAKWGADVTRFASSCSPGSDPKGIS